MQTLRIETVDGIATLTFDEPNSPVNTMCAAWQADIVAAVEQIAQNKDQLKGVILASARRPSLPAPTSRA
jgi:3-hydroxyacyl-CoA dehydrogenase/enoyl-CoA hydratase/3-hydroxybutyryl-CoA epimerase